MAQGDKKRTYVVTDNGIDSIEHIAENSRMDKSDVVDRAVKYYLKSLVNGDVDDPLVDDDISPPGLKGRQQQKEEDGGFMSRFRRKK